MQHRQNEYQLTGKNEPFSILHRSGDLSRTMPTSQGKTVSATRQKLPFESRKCMNNLPGKVVTMGIVDSFKIDVDSYRVGVGFGLGEGILHIGMLTQT